MKTIFFLALSLSLSSCGDLFKDSNDQDDYAYHYSEDYGLNENQDDYCLESCNKIIVEVRYALEKEITHPMTLVIEVFENPDFYGSSVLTKEFFDFKAKTGFMNRYSLDVGSGEYYLRAYLTDERSQREPGALKGLKAENKHVMGFFGASSNPVVAEVNGYGDSIRAPIELNQLYQAKDAPIGSDAHLRLLLSVGAVSDLPEAEEIKIELRSEINFELKPLHSFTLPSNSIKYSANGSAEFLSPELESDSYWVLVYIDSNKNGFFDEGEWHAFSHEDIEPRMIELEKGHTKRLDLVLNQ